MVTWRELDVLDAIIVVSCSLVHDQLTVAQDRPECSVCSPSPPNDQDKAFYHHCSDRPGFESRLRTLPVTPIHRTARRGF